MGNKSSSRHFMSLHGFRSKYGINAPPRTLHSEAAPDRQGKRFFGDQPRRDITVSVRLGCRSVLARTS
jgi:hypothetical protein